MRPRSFAVPLVALSLASGITACGGSSASSPTDVVKSYIKALGSADYATACGDIASSTKQAIQRASAGKSCEQALRTALTGANTRAVQALKGGTIGQARITGGTGTVPVSVQGLGSVPIQVVKEGGSWKVARAVGGG